LEQKRRLQWLCETSPNFPPQQSHWFALIGSLSWLEGLQSP
jgi:hypothetical protein